MWTAFAEGVLEAISPLQVATSFQTTFDAVILKVLELHPPGTEIVFRAKNSDRVKRAPANYEAAAIVAYLITEKAMIKFSVEDRLAADLGNLTGEAREARIVLSSLSDEEHARVQGFIEALPDGVMNDFLVAVGGFTTLQQVFDALLPTLKRYVSTRVPKNDLETFDPDFIPIVTLISAQAIVRSLWEESPFDDVKKDVKAILKDLPKSDQLDVLLDVKKKLDDEDALHSSKRLWTDDQLTQVGVTLWERTYKLGKDDTDVVVMSRAIAERWKATHPGDTGVSRLRVIEDLHLLLGEVGRPRLPTHHDDAHLRSGLDVLGRRQGCPARLGDAVERVHGVPPQRAS